MSKFTLKKQVEFDRDFIEWFDRTHPGSSFWWFINNMCRCYREQVESNSPLEIVQRTAKKLDVELRG